MLRALLASFLLATLAVPIKADELVVFLVRHAEKATGKDPALTAAGTARALELSKVLADSHITRVYSSDYLRTRLTAAPLVKRLGVELKLYDANNLTGLAEELKSHPGRYLVVGHSNTTPAMVRHLGGDPGTNINEDEYDRLYITSTSNENNVISTVQLRYGKHPIQVVVD